MPSPARSRVNVALVLALFVCVVGPGGRVVADAGDDAARIAAAAGVGGAIARQGSAPVTATGTLPRILATASPTYARVYRAGPRTNKVVALTFDDGYSPTETQAIFRILLAEHVRATFFPYARAMLEAPALWRQIATAGYPIGNHTYSHANLTHLSPAQVSAELTRARTTIRNVTGITEPAIMRPPYGAYTTATRQAAALAGYPVMALWDVDTRDWSGISAAAITARAAIGRPGSIVLMHAGPANTPRALRAIIARYRARGYSFVTVPELLGITGT